MLTMKYDMLTIDEDSGYTLLKPEILDPRIFNLDYAYFLEDVYYGDVADNDYPEDFIQFGAKDVDGEWMIPHDLPFSIKAVHGRYLFEATRNGITLEFIHLDGILLNIELTELGSWCFEKALKTGDSFEAIVLDALS